MIKLVIFDMDDTLFGSSNLADKARKNAIKAMIAFGLPVDFDEAYRKLYEIIEIFGSNYNMHFNELVKLYPVKHGGMVIASGMQAYHKTKYDEIMAFDGVYDVLKSLKKRGIMIILMTNGRLVKQWEKILLLKLDNIFDDYFVQDNVNHDISKKDIFKKILKKYNMKPKAVLSVGDRLNPDIKCSNELGINSVRVLKGKYAKSIPELDIEVPMFEISDICDLIELDLFCN